MLLYPVFEPSSRKYNPSALPLILFILPATKINLHSTISRAQMTVQSQG